MNVDSCPVALLGDPASSRFSQGWPQDHLNCCDREYSRYLIDNIAQIDIELDSGWVCLV